VPSTQSGMGRLHFKVPLGLIAKSWPDCAGLVLANLVHNAIEASPAGARVEVAALAGKDTVIFRVEDRGGGLRPEVRAALFEPVASSKPRGTGVGLAISRRLARHAGGDVSLERTGPGGTVFRVTVPSWSGVLPA
ncbi:MAG: sensor histidine kinase, partial [Opitutaceae bacterium]